MGSQIGVTDRFPLFQALHIGINEVSTCHIALEMRKPPTVRWGVFKKIRRRPTLPGGDLQVPSAQVGLTAVFEMGTGVTPPPKPPETYAYVTLVTGSLILKRFIASTNIYNSKPSAD